MTEQDNAPAAAAGEATVPRQGDKRSIVGETPCPRCGEWTSRHCSAVCVDFVTRLYTESQQRVEEAAVELRANAEELTRAWSAVGRCRGLLLRVLEGWAGKGLEGTPLFDAIARELRGES